MTRACSQLNSCRSQLTKRLTQLARKRLTTMLAYFSQVSAPMLRNGKAVIQRLLASWRERRKSCTVVQVQRSELNHERTCQHESPSASTGHFVLGVSELSSLSMLAGNYNSRHGYLPPKRLPPLATRELYGTPSTRSMQRGLLSSFASVVSKTDVTPAHSALE